MWSDSATTDGYVYLHVSRLAIAAVRGMSRLILVANRLPVSLDLSEGEVKIQESGGGLATGIRG